MIELSRRDFIRAVALLNHPVLSLEARCVANGSSPGKIYVDSFENPVVSIVWSKGIEGFFVAGDPKHEDAAQSLRIFVEEEIAPQAKEMGVKWFEVSGFEPAWDDWIERVFAKRTLRKEKVLIFRYPKRQGPSPRSQRPGVSIHRLDAAFFGSPPCDDLGLIEEKIEQFWPDLDSFLQSGLGFCAVQTSTLASVCMSGYAIEGTHLIDIETIDTHRRRGLAYQIGQAFVAHCLANSLSPQWGALEENPASCALAEMLGFDRVDECYLYSFLLGES